MDHTDTFRRLLEGPLYLDLHCKNLSFSIGPEEKFFTEKKQKFLKSKARISASLRNAQNKKGETTQGELSI